MEHYKGLLDAPKASAEASRFSHLVIPESQDGEAELYAYLVHPRHYYGGYSPNLIKIETRLNGLDSFPLEVLHMVLVQLDLASLMEFQRVNGRAWQIVQSVPEYRIIDKHAKFALRGTLAIGTGRFISCQALYTALCTAKCETCYHFGGYLYLITCKRVCYRCLTTKRVFLPLSTQEAVKELGLNQQILETLPQMKTISSVYAPMQPKDYPPTTLFDYDAALNACNMLHGSLENLFQKRMKNSESNRPLRRMRQFHHRYRRSMSLVRFSAVVRTPHFNRISRTTEMGFQCNPCQTSDGSVASGVRHVHGTRFPFRCRRVKFNDETYSKHLRYYHPELVGRAEEKHAKSTRPGSI